MKMVATLVMLWLVMAVAPETPVGRALWRGFVEMPAQFLNRITRGHVLLTALLVATVVGVVWLIGEEAVRLLSMASPEALSWLVMVDAASLLDVAMGVVLVATSVRIGAAWARVGAAWRRVVRRPRAVRTRPVRTERAADNDDEEPRRAMAA
ncbi:hypothetical protein EAH84_01090 [Sphingomonas oligophenolica]|uniref:Uncharacterized protein n=1 Tax=Sphingomonas oligophenolica TaxID=301154 RepID=A0A502CP60_9SPHN|nr:hypothetical protein EAH84_01090 [Sphingomonas oligophenolica]